MPDFAADFLAVFLADFPADFWRISGGFFGGFFVDFSADFAADFSVNFAWNRWRIFLKQGPKPCKTNDLSDFLQKSTRNSRTDSPWCCSLGAQV